MQGSRRLVWSVLLMTLGAASLVSAHPGHFYSAYHADTIAQGQELAAREGKLLLLHVRPAGSRPTMLIRWATPQTTELMDLIAQETVLVDLDAGEQAADLVAYDVTDLPAYILCQADGTPRQVLEGNPPPLAVQRMLEREVRSADAVDRVQSALENMGADHFFSRERMARTLVRLDRPAEALEQFVWCAEQGIAQQGQAAIVRRDRMFAAFAEFAKAYAPARVALVEARDQMERVLADQYREPRLATDYASVNLALGDDARTLIFFDSLPTDSPLRHALFDVVFDELLSAGRYHEMLALIDPMAAFRGEAGLARRRSVFRAASADAGSGRGTHEFALRRGAALVQALAGVQANAEAKALIDEMLAFDCDAPTVTLIAEHAQLGGSAELAAYAEERVVEYRDR
jgi:hypothetical protein